MSSSQLSWEVEYEYTVLVSALETFDNVMSRMGIPLEGNSERIVEFTSKRYLDLSDLKTRGIIHSYRISKVRRTLESLEEAGNLEGKVSQRPLPSQR